MFAAAVSGNELALFTAGLDLDDVRVFQSLETGSSPKNSFQVGFLSMVSASTNVSNAK